MPKPITEHTGKKYLREIYSAVDGTKILVDVYAVIEAFNITCPAMQHAVKKMLCVGVRGSKDAMQDLIEIDAAVNRAIVLQEGRDRREKEKKEEKEYTNNVLIVPELSMVERTNPKPKPKQICNSCTVGQHHYCFGKGCDCPVTVCGGKVDIAGRTSRTCSIGQHGACAVYSCDCECHKREVG